jgi:SSS family solute:Na+ symporter
LLGLGVTALVAGFMAGMAGNVSAFATVWTYDIYRPFLRKTAPDAHYVSMGRWCTMIGLFISIATAYLAMGFASIMDYVQALFSFFIAPLFGTVLLGMLWKRATTSAGFLGLLAGTLTSTFMFFAMRADQKWVAIFALSPHAQGLAQAMYQALWSCTVCVLVTVMVSYATKPRPESELKGLVMGVTDLPKEGALPLLQRPVFWGAAAMVAFLVLQWIFW